MHESHTLHLFTKRNRRKDKKEGEGSSSFPTDDRPKHQQGHAAGNKRISGFLHTETGHARQARHRDSTPAINVSLKLRSKAPWKSMFAMYAATCTTLRQATPKTASPPAQRSRPSPKIGLARSAEWTKVNFHQQRNKPRRHKNDKGNATVLRSASPLFSSRATAQCAYAVGKMSVLCI